MYMSIISTGVSISNQDSNIYEPVIRYVYMTNNNEANNNNQDDNNNQANNNTQEQTQKIVAIIASKKIRKGFTSFLSIFICLPYPIDPNDPNDPNTEIKRETILLDFIKNDYANVYDTLVSAGKDPVNVSTKDEKFTYDIYNETYYDII